MYRPCQHRVTTANRHRTFTFVLYRMRMRTPVKCLSFVIILLASAGAALAQSESGGAQLTGIVRDASGQVVPGVAITVKHADTGLTRTAVTDERGGFVFPALPIGAYSVDAALQGFATAKHDGVVLTVGQNQRLA